jgi:hypothetical protein
MSIFNPASAPCPVCKTEVKFPLVASVNADRRPDLRQQILDGSFQRERCPNCGSQFRTPPQLTYVDVGRHQWILVLPVAKLAAWTELERQASAAFERAYGEGAPLAAQEIGRGLSARIVFGWAALREKIFAADRGLDDVTLELLKIAVLRSVAGSSLSDLNELRLQEVEGESLVLAWIVAANEEVLTTLPVPKSVYDDIIADPTAWHDLRETLSASRFVDYNRLLVGTS